MLPDDRVGDHSDAILTLVDNQYNNGAVSRHRHMNTDHFAELQIFRGLFEKGRVPGIACVRLIYNCFGTGRRL